jgi:outer membrane protein assembly factor BamD (BamD/ComL family)
MRTVGLAAVVVSFLAVAGLVAAPAEAIEVWMPETGEVGLEDLPRATAEAHRRHALALLGAGQWQAGVAELRRLIAAEPTGDWVPEARFAVARGLLAGGELRQAFDELDELRTAYPEAPFAGRLRGMQLQAARAQCETDPDLAVELYDRLIGSAADADEASFIQKEKADALFSKRRYLDAEDQYVALMSLFPRSRWVPYCWYRVAECEWELARWLGLGIERLQVSERHFRDFADRYPQDVQAPAAREKAAEARREQASFYWKTARFYVDAARKPWAAISYLQLIQREFPDAPEAEWAAAELERIGKELPFPLRGTMKDLELPGVGPAGPAEQGP